jgi:hypothetical protein
VTSRRRRPSPRVVPLHPREVLDPTCRQALANLRAGLILMPAQVADIIEALVLDLEAKDRVLEHVHRLAKEVADSPPLDVTRYLRPESPAATREEVHDWLVEVREIAVELSASDLYPLEDCVGRALADLRDLAGELEERLPSPESSQTAAESSIGTPEGAQAAGGPSSEPPAP